MKRTSTLIVCIVLIAASVISVVSCNKKFDAPPPYVPPDLTPTLTVAQLKAMHTAGSTETISTNDIIEGVVVANDSSGNFYKQIIIEDSSAGIAVNIDDYNLYTSYPVGRKVFVKLNGLILFDDAKLIELGGSKDASNNVSGIAAPVKYNYVVKGTINNFIAPKVVDITNLNDSYQNMLIQITNAEFSAADTTKTYADTSPAKNSVNFFIKQCSGSSTITLRTSGYASFAGANVPNGNGTLTGIYSVFNTTKQLYIRDSSDVQFAGERCSGAGGSNTLKWRGGSFSSNLFAKISAYKSGIATVKTWLVTPVINLTGVSSPVLTFGTVDGYDDGATLKAYISTNYTGGATPWTSTWTPLTATVSSGHTSGYASSFLSSGNIDLSSYSGNVYIAFVYEGNDPSNTTTYELDDVKVASGATNVFFENFSSVTNNAEVTLSGWVNAPQ